MYRRDHHHYVVNPIGTVFADGHYYLVTYDSRYGKISNYRIDRMEKVEIEWTKDVELPPEEMNFDIAQYKKQLFGMFNGEATAVTIDIDKSLVDAVFDLFGEHTKIVTSGENTVRFTVNVQVSDLFFGWCSSFGEKVKLLAPQETVESFKEYLNNIQEQY